MKNIEEDKILILVMKRKDKYSIVIFIALDLNTFSHSKYTYNVWFIYYFTYNETDAAVASTILLWLKYGYYKAMWSFEGEMLTLMSSRILLTRIHGVDTCIFMFVLVNKILLR